MTPAQIRNEAAKKLNIFGEGQTLRAEHSADLDNAYSEIHAELQHDDMVYWSGSADIPTRYENAMIALVAHARASKYNVPMERYNQITLEGAGIPGQPGHAMRTIWKLSEISKMGSTPIENF